MADLVENDNGVVVRGRFRKRNGELWDLAGITVEMDIRVNESTTTTTVVMTKTGGPEAVYSLNSGTVKSGLLRLSFRLVSGGTILSSSKEFVLTVRAPFVVI